MNIRSNWAKNEMVSTGSSNRGKGTFLTDGQEKLAIVATTAAMRKKNTDLICTLQLLLQQEKGMRKKGSFPFLSPFLLSCCFCASTSTTHLQLTVHS